MFAKKDALYSIRNTFLANQKRDALFARVVASLKADPAYNDPHSKILIEDDAIYFGHSLQELAASFPWLNTELVGNRVLSESTLQAFVTPLDITRHIPSIEESQKALLEEASNFFKTMLPVTNRKVIPPRLPGNANDVLLSVVDKNQGVIIGERHQDIAPKKLLCDNMAKLKQKGVKVLFLEHLFDETHRELLDAYFKSPSVEMPAMLKAYLQSQDTGQTGQVKNNTSYSFTEVVKQAKIHGIRIIPIDTIASYSIGGELVESEDERRKRALMMNYVAAKRIQEYQKEPDSGKFVVFCGSMHINAANSKVPGLTEITGMPTIVVEDLSLDKPQQETISVSPQVLSKPDVFIQMKPIDLAQQLKQERAEIVAFLTQKLPNAFTHVEFIDDRVRITAKKCELPNQENKFKSELKQLMAILGISEAKKNLVNAAGYLHFEVNKRDLLAGIKNAPVLEKNHKDSQEITAAINKAVPGALSGVCIEGDNVMLIINPFVSQTQNEINKYKTQLKQLMKDWGIAEDKIHPAPGRLCLIINRNALLNGIEHAAVAHNPVASAVPSYKAQMPNRANEAESLSPKTLGKS
ncbi:membrane-targeted effector domain-containing toxin [Legionella waltersii]|uniref:Uncharacterized protein n=1 Tax=Legionella waltersii TaxID=66969 RepID=A0A0W1ANT2_9GAMM|nr:membrane-targeted effector domain-containing toxin [Legionella waltersii]KTD82970.1 hypothetical protein Lwal_0189 [Legionella waltersii]SNU97252.1 C-terminal region of Pasteurella multocida toxin residues 569-1285 [Legionella waltersii]